MNVYSSYSMVLAQHPNFIRQINARSYAQAQHLLPCFDPPSSAVGATRIVSPPDGLMTSPEDSKDLDDTMR